MKITLSYYNTFRINKGFYFLPLIQCQSYLCCLVSFFQRFIDMDLLTGTWLLPHILVQTSVLEVLQHYWVNISVALDRYTETDVTQHVEKCRLLKCNSLRVFVGLSHRRSTNTVHLFLCSITTMKNKANLPTVRPHYVSIHYF